jgi:hypothetical protein
MEDCIVLARTTGERVGRELGIPVYLYERAASRPDRVRTSPTSAAGSSRPRRPRSAPTRTASPTSAPTRSTRPPAPRSSARGPSSSPSTSTSAARENLHVAKNVAKAVRGSSGGLKGVKGLGLEVDGQAQVSMNLVDLDATPLHRAYEMVKMEAEAQGVTPTWSEIVGLVPERALFETAARHLRWRTYTPELVLERQGAKAASGGESLAASSPRSRARRRSPAAARWSRSRRLDGARSRRWSPASPSAARSTSRWKPR